MGLANRKTTDTGTELEVIQGSQAAAAPLSDTVEEMEIDLLDLAYVLLDKVHYIILCLLAGAVLLNAFSFFCIQPTYQATAKMYVVSASNDSVVDLTDLNIGTSLTSDYEQLMLSYPVLDQVISDLGLDMETEDLADFPDDELGEIAERIVKIYKRLQNSRREQGVLKRQLTQNIAHELKTPVSSIQGYLETILQNPRINEDTKQQFLQRCYAQSERLTALLRDISTLNRMDDAPDMMDFDAVDISAKVDSIRKEVA